MDLELADKVAVVTGASKGIGLAVAHELAAEGALVVAGARTVASLEGIANVSPFAVDLVDPNGPARLVAAAIERHGRIDVLVNNLGGVRLRLDGFLSTSDADFQASLELNFFSAPRATRAAVAAMMEQGGGTIVNVASVNAFFHPDGAVIDYGAAKAALLNVAKALSQELGPHGVRIASPSRMRCRSPDALIVAASAWTRRAGGVSSPVSPDPGAKRWRMTSAPRSRPLLAQIASQRLDVLRHEALDVGDRRDAAQQQHLGGKALRVDRDRHLWMCSQRACLGRSGERRHHELIAGPREPDRDRARLAVKRRIRDMGGQRRGEQVLGGVAFQQSEVTLRQRHHEPPHRRCWYDGTGSRMVHGDGGMTSVSGDWKAFGAVRVLALLDAVVDYPWPLAELFPGVPDEAWTPFRERFPTAFGGAQVWRSSYRCYLVRSEGRTVLVDTGMGAAGSPLSATLGLAGELMEALDAAGTRPDEIDIVVLTHLHPDHVGGNLRGDALAFPRARYVVPQADWQHFHLPEVQAHFPFPFVEQTITPLERLGALELITGEHALTGELTVIPTPGHTPGHTSLRIDSSGEQALLIADALLHPAQVTEPDWISMFDVDPDQERRTRRDLLDQLETEALVFSASHFPEPAFGRVVREDGRRYWRPQP